MLFGLTVVPFRHFVISSFRVFNTPSQMIVIRQLFEFLFVSELEVFVISLQYPVVLGSEGIQNTLSCIVS